MLYYHQEKNRRMIFEVMMLKLSKMVYTFAKKNYFFKNMV